jgi:hypothetical protein
MKEHFCPAEQSMITYQGECNWCGEQEALAQTQEPHGWYIDGYGAVIGTAEPKSVRVGEWLPWYTSTPQRTFVGLTRAEQSFVYSNLHNATSREDSFWVDFANAIEAKLKEKNT